jgi:hypothetical protein
MLAHGLQKSGYYLNKKRQNYEINGILWGNNRHFAARPKNAVNLCCLNIYQKLITMGVIFKCISVSECRSIEAKLKLHKSPIPDVWHHRVNEIHMYSYGHVTTARHSTLTFLSNPSAHD